MFSDNPHGAEDPNRKNPGVPIPPRGIQQRTQATSLPRPKPRQRALHQRRRAPPASRRRTGSSPGRQLLLPLRARLRQRPRRLRRRHVTRPPLSASGEGGDTHHHRPENLLSDAGMVFLESSRTGDSGGERTPPFRVVYERESACAGGDGEGSARPVAVQRGFVDDSGESEREALCYCC